MSEPIAVTQLIMALSNLIREEGQLCEPESEEDFTDRWIYSPREGISLVFHAFDEYTNRIYDVPNPLGDASLYQAHQLDIRENTFDAIRYPKGGESSLRAYFTSLELELAAISIKMKAQDEAQKAQGLSVVDGMGTHKL